MKNEDVSVNPVAPYFVARLSGLPVQEVELLHSAPLSEAVRELLSLDRRIDASTESASAVIHAAIGELGDKKIRNKALQIRRKLFAGKALGEAERDILNAVVGTERWPVVLEQCALIEHRTLTEETIQLMYARALVGNRRQVQQSVRRPAFQRGLLLSSSTLFANLKRYVALEPADVTSRDEQIERGLLRYLTRASMKATPFSTFCTVVPGRFVAGTEAGPSSEFVGALGRVQSFVRLDKRLYAKYLGHLVSRANVRDCMDVELNSTMCIMNGRAVFLALLRGVEAFQRLNTNEILDFIADCLTESKTFGVLRAKLDAAAHIDATPDEIEAYLKRLLDVGFLRLRGPVADQVADWDEPLREHLLTIQDDHAQSVAQTLGALRSLITAYSDAGISERAALLKQMTLEISLLDSALGLVSAANNRDTVIYEDSTAAAELQISTDGGVVEALNRFVEFVSITQPAANRRSAQATMRHFFDTYYCNPHAAIPLLTFYEDYYREHFKGHLEKESEQKKPQADNGEPGYDVGNPFRLQFIQSMRKSFHTFDVCMRERLARNSAADVLEVTRADLVAAFGQLPMYSSCRSVASFCQIVPRLGEKEPATVVARRGYTMGYGKFFSRFLYALPQEIQERIRKENVSLTPDCLAEIAGDAAFNANLHPPLLEMEIGYPTGQAGSQPMQLRTSELEVAIDGDDPNALILRDQRTERLVRPVDLGFLNPRMRPPLFQLLSSFEPGATFNLPWPDATVGEASNAEASAVEATRRVRYRPRVVYEKLVVLANRQWTIPNEHFPRMTNGMTAVAYFVMIQRWRSMHGIPEQVYVTLAPESSNQLPRLETPRRVTSGTHTENDDEDTLVALQSDSAGDEFADERIENGSDDIETLVALAADSPNAGTEFAEADKAPTSAGPAPHLSASGAARHKAVSRPVLKDWGKPQFIDFGSPVLVAMFEKLPARLTRFQVKLIERYPDTRALPAHKDAHYASELILHVNFPAPQVGAVPPFTVGDSYDVA